MCDRERRIKRQSFESLRSRGGNHPCTEEFSVKLDITSLSRFLAFIKAHVVVVRSNRLHNTIPINVEHFIRKNLR